jgi:hypothetical protein
VPSYKVKSSGRVYEVFRGNFQEPWVYEFPYGKGIDTVKRDYSSDNADYRRMWNTSSDPPFANPQRWGYKEGGNVNAFARANITLVRFSDLPKCPSRVETSFGGEPDGRNTKPGYIKWHRLVENHIRQALARVFDWCDQSGYQIRTFHSYCWRPLPSGHLSNHCLGVALDINAAQNWIHDHVWDMPKEIVQIMIEEGFGWGGAYGGNGQDAMHFEYRKPTLDPVGSVSASVPLSFPLGGQQSPAPIRAYWNTEDAVTGVGGYYGLGLQRNVHGGVHFFPGAGAQRTEVYATAPGYVVAVRLPRTAENVQEVAASVLSYTGFVLVRHDVKLRTKVEDEFPEKGLSLYSLYMHLLPLTASFESSAPAAEAPPAGAAKGKSKRKVKGFSAAWEKDPYFQSVRWFAELMRRSFGTLTKLFDDPSEPAGTTYWLKQEVPDDKPQPGQQFYVYDRKDPIEAVDKDGNKRWLYKPSSAEFGDVIHALDQGKLVTFSEPFFPVDPDDALGLVGPVASPKPVRRTVPRTADRRDSRRSRPATPEGPRLDPPVKLSSGFLHWELFSPVKEGKSAVSEILKFGRDNLPELSGRFGPKDVVEEITDDNFLELDEIENKILGCLEEAEKTSLVQAVGRMRTDETRKGPLFLRNTMLDVVDFFADGKNFAPPSQDDTVEAPAQPKPFTYPLELQIESDDLLTLDQLASGKDYEIKIEYYAPATRRTSGTGSASGAAGGAGEASAAGAGTGSESLGDLLETQTLRITRALWRESPDDLRNKREKERNAKRPNNRLPEPNHKHLSFKLRVPAQAVKIRLVVPPDAPGRLGDIMLATPAQRSEDDGAKLLAAMVGRRFRGTRLSHLSEWSPSAVKKRYEKMKSVGLLPPTFDPEILKPLAWWHEDAQLLERAMVKDPDRPTVRVDDKGELSLWGAELPPDSKIDNAHPTSLAWLLAILQNRKLADIGLPPRAAFHKEDPTPAAMGWVPDGGAKEAKLGDPVHILVIDDDFGYDSNVQVTINAESDQGAKIKVADQQGWGENGVFHMRTYADFWGTWKLSVEGAGEVPEVIGKKELTFPAPRLKQPDAERFYPRRVGRKFAWTFPVEENAPVPHALRGFIGIETSKDKVSWSEPDLPIECETTEETPVPTAPTVVRQGRKGLGATAYGAGGETGIEIDSKSFIIKDDAIVGLAPGTKANVHVTKRVTHASYCKAMRDVKIACSLADALREAEADVLPVKSLEHSGAACVLSMPSWREGAKVAIRCLEKGVFSSVGIPDDSTALKVDDLKQNLAKLELDHLKKLRSTGLRLEVKDLKKAEECKHVLRDDLEISQDGLYVVGKRGRAGKITAGLRFDSLIQKAPVHIDCGLARAIEAIATQAKKKVLAPLALSWDGTSCTLPGLDLLGIAQSVPSVAYATARGKHTEIGVGHGMGVTFDPSQLLSDLRHTLGASDTLYYRFYFCAVNGASLYRPEFTSEETMGMEQARLYPGLDPNNPAQARIVRCSEASGALTPVAFGEGHGHLVGKKVWIDVKLKGNRSVWANATLSLGGSSLKKKVHRTVSQGDAEVHFEVDRIGFGNDLKYKVEVADGSYDLMAQAPDGAISAEVTVPGRPKLSTPKTKVIDNHVVVWCDTQGIVAPAGATAETPFAFGDATTKGRVGALLDPRLAKPAKPVTLRMGVRGAARDPVPAVEYFQPAKGGGGYVTRESIFAARILKGDLHPAKTYEIYLEYKSDGSSTLVASSKIEYRAGAPDFVADGPFADIRLLEQAARLDNAHYVGPSLITALRMIWYGATDRPPSLHFLDRSVRNLWDFLIPHAAGSAAPPSWQGMRDAYSSARSHQVREVEGGRVDLGRLFVGLDASDDPLTLPTFAETVTLRSGREALTFVGDLGAVVADAISRAGSSSVSESMLAASFHSLITDELMHANADVFSLPVLHTQPITTSLDRYYTDGDVGVSKRFAAFRAHVDAMGVEVLTAETAKSASANLFGLGARIGVASDILNTAARLAAQLLISELAKKTGP